MSSTYGKKRCNFSLSSLKNCIVFDKLLKICITREVLISKICILVGFGGSCQKGRWSSGTNFCIFLQLQERRWHHLVGLSLAGQILDLCFTVDALHGCATIPHYFCLTSKLLFQYLFPWLCFSQKHFSFLKHDEIQLPFSSCTLQGQAPRPVLVT